MVLLEILCRPSMERLLECLNNPNLTCLFWVRPINAGVTSQFRLNTKVIRRHKGPVQQLVRFELTEQDSGENLMLLAEVDKKNNRVGTIDARCAREAIRLRWCGVESRTCRLLAAHGINSLGDLKLYTEVGVCELLFMPGEARIRKARIAAVHRFIRMRNRLNEAGFSRNPCESETGWATAGQLRAAVAR